MIERLWGLLPRGRWLVTAVPYLWLTIFFLIPFAIVLKIAFSSTLIAMPPYEPLLHWTADKVVQIKLNLGNFAFLVEDNLYWMAYLNSIKVAAISTLLCLLIGYPISRHSSVEMAATLIEFRYTAGTCSTRHTRCRTRGQNRASSASQQMDPGSRQMQSLACDW